ncbi:MAG: carbohydrate ABC transporter permease [Mycoplasmatales bacterium]
MNRVLTEMRKNYQYYLLMAPFMILFFLFVVIPVVMSFVLSFTDFNMLESPNFIGLGNYINLLVNDDVFQIALRNTLFLAIVTGPISYFLAFILAWLINELPKRLRAFMTLVFYAPALTGNAYLIWKIIFSGDIYGFINSRLIDFGFINEPIQFLSNPQYIMTVLIIVQLWMGLGISFLAFRAGLQGVDKSMYEAGAIDGIKNRWLELWYITLPAMKPQLIFGAVMQISSAFALSAISVEMVGFPSTDYAGHTIITHLMDFGSIRYELGYASAIATILFIIMIVTNLFVQKMIRKVGS